MSAEDNAKAFTQFPSAYATQESVVDTSNGQDVTLSQLRAVTLDLRTFCDSLLALHNQRYEQSQSRINAVEEMLLEQIAELETRTTQTSKQLDARILQEVSTLTPRIAAAENVRLEAELRSAAAEARSTSVVSQENSYKQAWYAAPLTLRLRFVRELLPADHQLQRTLKEAAALEELRLRGRDLETWLSNYPALFADSVQVFLVEGANNAVSANGSELHPVDSLATQTLFDAQSILETTLQAFGITWIAPLPGDVISADHEVVGEERSSERDGRIARVIRRGFRIQGQLAQPAQVIRASIRNLTVKATDVPTDARSNAEGENPTGELTGSMGKSGSTPTMSPNSLSNTTPFEQSVAESETSALQESAGSSAKTNGDVDKRIDPAHYEHNIDFGVPPDWLRILGQRTFGCDVPAVGILRERIIALGELPAQLATKLSEDQAVQMLRDALMPLLPLLGMRYADGLPGLPNEWGEVFMELRDPLLVWLTEQMNVLVFGPIRGECFNSEVMESVETRRTVHSHEDGTVAKLERVGILWRDRPLIRAKVVRYAAGGMT